MSAFIIILSSQLTALLLLLLLLRAFTQRKFARATNALCWQRWQYGYVTVYISIAISHIIGRVQSLQATITRLAHWTLIYLCNSVWTIPHPHLSENDKPHSMQYQCMVKGKGSPYSITERRVPELIPVLGSQHAGDVSHKPGGRLPLLSTRPAVTQTTLKGAATNFAAC